MPYNSNPSGDKANQYDVEERLEWDGIDHGQSRQWRDCNQQHNKKESENQQIDQSPRIAWLYRRVRFTIGKRVKHYVVSIEPFSAAAISGIMIS